jgi:hypothetical protein
VLDLVLQVGGLSLTRL